VTRNQQIFADEYLTDRNATRAYKVAYPRIKNDKVAGVNGARLLANASVDAYIREQLEALHTSKVCSAQEILEYLSSVVRGESESEVMVVEGEGPGITQARRKLKRPDEKERLKAAELMSKYHQLLVPKVQVEANGGGGLIILQEATDGQP